MNPIQLIPAKETDFEFLKNVHHTTMKEHVEMIWGWDEVKQDQMFKEEFNPLNIQIISFKEQPIGYLELNRKEQSITLVNILILPKYQGHGIGSKIVKDLIAEAQNSNKTLELGVFKTNPRAKKTLRTLRLYNPQSNPHSFSDEKKRLGRTAP